MIPVLDDDYEPATPRRSIRAPMVVLASLALIAGAAFVTIRAGVWTPDTSRFADAQFQAPPAAAKRHDLWYPDSVESVWARSQIASPVESHPPTPPSRPRVAAKPLGFLAINSTPWAELSVDGRVVGNTPQIKVPVAPGRHQLVLARAGFATRRTSVSVVPGATVRITDITLQRVAQ